MAGMKGAHLLRCVGEDGACLSTTSGLPFLGLHVYTSVYYYQQEKGQQPPGLCSAHTVWVVTLTFEEFGICWNLTLRMPIKGLYNITPVL